jgi:hypothetical protein
MDTRASTPKTAEGKRDWPLLPCCPLFEPTEEDLFSQVATGTLLKVRNNHFMLTAGHVCDQLAESNFLFPSAEGFSILHGEVAIRGHNDRGDVYDSGYVLLDTTVAEQMKHFFAFATPKNVDINEYPLEGDWYSFSGFPYRKRKIRGKQISSPLFSYHLQAASKEAYYRLDVNPYSHIICNFNRKRYVTPEGRSLTAPLPHGLSGGPIVNYTKEVDPRTNPTTTKLAGICTEFHEKTRVLIGVRIAGFVQAILHRHPELTDEFERIELLT